MQEDPALPQELFDLTINHCARRLFSHLRIGPLDEAHSLDKFPQLLENSPTFAARVTSLHLCTNWILDESQSGEFLSPLVALTRLCITSGGLNWDEISAPLPSSIQLTLMRPNFTCLEVRHTFRIIFESEDTNDPDAAVSAGAGSSPTQLDHLSLSLDMHSLGVLARRILLPEFPLNLSSLRSLSYGVYLHSLAYDGDEFEDAVLSDLLRASASSLRSLQLKNCEEFPATGMLNLSELAALQTLSLEIWLDISPTEDLHLLSLAHFIFSPRQQALNLFFNIYTQHARLRAVQLLAAADRALVAFPFIASTCPGVVAHEMPLLLNRLRPGALLVLQSSRVPNT
ncbi:hypothetical protein B0H12DRAFT_1232129 [Mycena haematopus]|nr:hypothetical protein B0H12DRAFT_1232129 [Mycena haematopus]